MNIRITCIAAACATAALFASAALAAAAEDTKAPTQQSRFATCSHESKGLRGDDHQNFMSECLKGHETEAAEIRKEGQAHHTAAGEPGLQQTKMKVCNEEAGQKSLHGDERRAFMSSCLKGQ